MWENNIDRDILVAFSIYYFALGILIGATIATVVVMNALSRIAC